MSYTKMSNIKIRMDLGSKIVKGSHPFEVFGFKFWVTPGQNNLLTFGRHFVATEERTGGAIPGLRSKKRSDMPALAIAVLNRLGEKEVRTNIGLVPDLSSADRQPSADGGIG